MYREVFTRTPYLLTFSPFLLYYFHFPWALLLLKCVFHFSYRAFSCWTCSFLDQQLWHSGKWKENGYGSFVFIMPLCHPEIYADNLLGRLWAPVEYRATEVSCIDLQHLLQLLGSLQASLLPNAVAIAGQTWLEVIFTGHVYNLQSDLSHWGLISQRSMATGEFQRLSSLSNFLCPNEMAETCLESFRLETLRRVNKEYDIHESEWAVIWLPIWWFMPQAEPTPCPQQGVLTMANWRQGQLWRKDLRGLGPSRWIPRPLLL